jgi:hypothetical protein
MLEWRAFLINVKQTLHHVNVSTHLALVSSSQNLGWELLLNHFMQGVCPSRLIRNLLSK